MTTLELEIIKETPTKRITLWIGYTLLDNSKENCL